MKKCSKYLMTAAVAATMAFTNASNAAETNLERITIGTSPAGSLTFLLGNGFAKLFQEQLGVRATAQPHAGSTVYLGLVNNGEMTLGLGNGIDTAEAYLGRPPFNRPHDNLRLLASVWVIPLGLIVKADSGIRTAADLEGKRVVTEVGTVRALTSIARAYLASAGLTADDVTQITSGGLARNVELVVEGRADAAPIAYSAPAVAQAHSTVPGGIRIISLGPKGDDAFMHDQVDGLRTLLVTPHESRPFFEEDTLIAAFDTNFNIGADVSNEDAYLFAKTLHENWAAMQEAFPPLRRTNADELAAPSNGIPFHDGAIQYYRDAGIWTAENDAQQAALR